MTGIYSPQSPFEMAWEACPPCHAMIPKRVERFDASTGLLYTPLQYEYLRLPDCTDKMPSLDWIASAFLAFVRGEFGSGSSRGDCPSPVEWERSGSVSLQPLYDYLEHSETTLVFGGLVESAVRESEQALMSEQLYALIKDPVIGNRSNARHMTLEAFASVVNPLIEEQLPLTLAMPAFPFKDQNVFRTEAPPDSVDLGEIALIIRLHVLSLALYQVHPFTVDWVIMSDGIAYAPVFGVDETEAARYRQRLLEYRNLLNLQRTVSIIDLQDMTRRISSKAHGSEIFDFTAAHIRSDLEKMVARGSGGVFEAFRALNRGTKWNMNNKRFFKDLGWWNLWSVLNAETADEVDSGLQDAWHHVDRLAQEAAYGYAAFNLALRHHSVFEQLLPRALRATIHPKQGQIAVPSLGSVYPWNGVAVLRDARLGPNSVESWPLYGLIRECPRAVPYRLYGSGAPLYYEFLRT